VTHFLQSEELDSDTDEVIEKDYTYYKNKAENEWMMWRLIFSGNMNKHDVFEMDTEELKTANAALDIHIEKMNKAFNS